MSPASVPRPQGDPEDRDTILVEPDGVRYADTPRAAQLDPWFEVVRERGPVEDDRLWESVDRYRCEVCGEPGDRAPEGMLWVLDGEPPAPWPDWIDTVRAPVCAFHARDIAEEGGHFALRARLVEPVGVLGTRYDPDTGRALPEEEYARFRDPEGLRHVLARRLVLRLTAPAPAPWPTGERA
ncbi:hypothetical protein ACN20G_06090 [Streptomyces sp. BI20]|uniref:hypothetical protein n=1 Tax=Streptomyces sp. BI20 TaxID=3403460 RepID=UPI003C76121F